MKCKPPNRGLLHFTRQPHCRQKEVVRESIQGDLTVDNVASELEALLFTNKRNDVMADYENILRILDTGSASENAGRLMVGYLG